jgi:predicted transcriptional regulator
MSETTRATIYLDSDLHRALRLKAASTHRSVSELVAEAVREALREDQEDLAAVRSRAAEPSMAYEVFLKKLKADGTV